MRVAALAVTPVKGTRLHGVDEVRLTPRGAAGDREFFVIDERDRMVNAKTLGELQRVVARFDAPRLAMTLPDGEVEADVAYDGSVEARFYSRSVSGRLVRGPWSQALSALTGQPLRLVHAPGSVDRGTGGGLTLISQASLEALASAAGVDSVDARRFRMLVEIDGVGAHEEDEWVGRFVRLGDDVTVRFRGHVGRCLITSRDPDSGQIDLPTLDILRDYRGEADTTAPLPFGIYGGVVREGVLRLGDRVTLEPR